MGHAAPVRPTQRAKRANGVAVGAHKLALRDLDQDPVRRATREPRAGDVPRLLEIGQVIPLHDLRIEYPPAISTGSAGFQAPRPGTPRERIRGPRPPGNRSADLSLVALMVNVGD